MDYQSTRGTLAAPRQSAEMLAERERIALQCTDTLRALLRDVYLSTLGRLSETERQYILDASRGRVASVDLVRVILAVRRSRDAKLTYRLHQYLRTVASVDERPILAIERALLRRAIEQGEANTAVERYRYQPSLATLDSAIAEIDDDIATDHALRASLLAERAKLSA